MQHYQIDSLIAAGTSILILILTGAALLFIIRRRMREQHELRRALLEKLPAEELIRLAGSDSGRAWLRDVLVGTNDPKSGVERALQVMFAGIGCGVASALLYLPALGAAGVILAAAGLGQLIATLVLSRRKASDEK